MDLEWCNWVREARQIQNQMCKVLGNRMYDEIDPSNLKNKVSFAIFGMPKSGYNKEQLKLIEEVNKKIISLSGNPVYINVVYVAIKLKSQKLNVSNQDKRFEVIFRIGVKKNRIFQPPMYLDLALRVYKDYTDYKDNNVCAWKHYLETNKLPKCYMCYPVNGVYKKDEDDIVKLGFGESHACDEVSSFLNIADKMSTAGGLISLGITGASLFTPIGLPIVIGALATSAVSGVYDVGRNLAKLSDMKEHDEDMESSEANMAVLGVFLSAAGVASVGSSAALKTAQKIGVKGSRNLLKVMKILNISSLCLNGTSVVIGMYNIVLKCCRGDLESKDVFAFVLSCLFMFNAVISMAMAERMIKEISQKHISTLGNVVSMVSCTVCPTIYVLNEYENYKRLLSLFVGLPAIFAASIDLHKIECSILNIRDKVNSGVKGKVNLKSFVSNISRDLQEIWECYKNECKQMVTVLYNIVFNPAFYLKSENGQMVPRPLNIAIMHDLSSEVRRTAENLSLNHSEEVIKKRVISIMQLARDFDKRQPAENLSEFFFKVKFVCQNLEDKFQELKIEYENKLDVAMMKKDFNKYIFNCRNGIRSDNLNNHFFLESIKQCTEELPYRNHNFQEKESIKDNHFQDFECESVFVYVCPTNGSKLIKKEYFSYATEFSGVKIDKTTSKIFTDGRTVILNPLCQQPVPRVLFYNPENTEETCPTGIVVVQKNPKKLYFLYGNVAQKKPKKKFYSDGYGVQKQSKKQFYLDGNGHY